MYLEGGAQLNHIASYIMCITTGDSEYIYYCVQSLFNKLEVLRVFPPSENFEKTVVRAIKLGSTLQALPFVFLQ